MYSRFQIAKKYASFYIQASSGKGHGVHSPFVFDFITHVLRKHNSHPAFHIIENYRKELKRSKTILSVEDFGAGSNLSKGAKRKVSDIAKHSLKRPKYARLLHRIASYYHCKNIVEMGTSLGTTTAYLATASSGPLVTTLEGAKEIAAIAKKFFLENHFENIRLLEGNFSNTIPEVLRTLTKIDLLFADGNHRKEPTLEYFDTFLTKAGNDSIFIFDDIHWSKEMEEAWKIICEHPAVTMSIDLFFAGIVFFKKEFLVKQHFSLRY